MADFADRIKLLRLMKQMTLDELAERLHTSKQVLSRYELRQRFPKVPIVKKYAEILNVDPVWLMGYATGESPDGVDQKRATLCSLVDAMNDKQIDLIIAIAQSIRDTNGDDDNGKRAG